MFLSSFTLTDPSAPGTTDEGRKASLFAHDVNKKIIIIAIVKFFIAYGFLV
jgi:hypothetical protein